MSQPTPKQIIITQDDVKENMESLQNECLERMLISRTSLVKNFPFFTILASKLKPVANTSWCKTLAVDGKHLFYNPIYVMGYSKLLTPTKLQEVLDDLRQNLPDHTEEQIQGILGGLTDNNLTFAICHEILHCAYDHFGRLGMRDPSIWNQAADYAINQILVRSKIGQIHETWLLDPAFENMAAEEIYEFLKEERKKQQQGQNSSGDDSNGGGSGQGQAKRQKSHRGGSQDYHGGNPSATKEQQEENMKNFRSSVVSAAQSKGTPSEIAEFVTELVTPKIDWRSKLHRSMRSLMRSDLTYMNPSRRSWIGGALSGSFYGQPVFPGYKPDETIDICIALDASGSISEEMLRDFLSEVIGITKQFQQFKIRILTFDTSVYTVRDYTTGEERKILEYPIHGGGGTDFMCVYEHMKAENYRPKQMVMFTDGMPCGQWGDPDYCKALFVVHTYKVEAPFGDTVHYDYIHDDVN